MAGKSGRASKKESTRKEPSGRAPSRSRASRSDRAGRVPQIVLASILAVAGLLFVPLLAENAIPWLRSTRSGIQNLLGLGSYLAPVLLLALAALLALSLRKRGFRLHWTRGVGWLAFFIGILGLLHRFSSPTSGNSLLESAGGSLGSLVFAAAERLVGPWLAVVLLAGLVLAGAAAGFGVPLQRFRVLWRAVREFVLVARRLGRALPPVLRRVGRFVGAAASAAAVYGTRLAAAVNAGARRATATVFSGLVTVREQLSPSTRQAPNDATAREGELALATLAPAASPPKAGVAGSGARAKPTVAAEPPRPANGGNGWQLPPLTLLEEGPAPEASPLDDEERLKSLERTIEKTLAEFGVPVKVVERRPGPAVTQFGVEPQFHEKRARDGTVLRRERVKVREITARANDLALALAARSIRIEAPVPGKPMVGIEVPNTSTSVVSLRSELESRAFQRALSKSALPIVLGRDVSGEVITADLARMPHLLIAGATGSGKSVCINSIIATLLMNHTPDELRFLMIDPKRVELTLFDAIPHLLRPVVVDVEKAVPALFQCVAEMDRRYKEFAATGVRNIEGYNRLVERDPERKPLPYLVLVIDELADLMMLAADEVERTLCRLAQLARATGIHLVVATQRPSVDVVTGLIKANFPTRISFMVTSQVDSRTILDTVGAEKLLGRGDMLYLPSDAPKPLRLQGTFLTDQETEALTAYWRAQRPAQYAPEFVDLPSWTPGSDEGDELYDKAVELAREHDSISISFLQRRLRIGWNRAARLMDMLEENGELGGRGDDVDDSLGGRGEDEN